MMITRISLVLVLALAFGAGCAWAQEAAWVDDVSLLVNGLKIFPVTELKRVAISNPEIADVTIISEREVMLMAKSEGKTSLIIWDQSGQQTFNIDVQAEDLEKVADRIRVLLASSDIRRIKLKTEQDKIFLVGEVLAENDLNEITDIIASFPQAVNLVRIKERQPLVEIDVNILEVILDDQKNLGMDWSNSLPLQHTESSTNRTDGKLANIWRVLRWDRSAIDARLNLLIQEDKARTLANPKLVTLSGKEASFLVGGEIPFLTVETEGRTQVEWKDYGVTLKIVPVVNDKNEIKTQIKAEVSDLDAANAVTQSGYNIPAFKKRQAETELFLNEGDVVFIAGLIKNEDSQNLDRLPWLSKVPILGELFKSTEFKDKRTELVISLSPRIIGEKAGPDLLARQMREEEARFKNRKTLAHDTEEGSALVYYSHMIEDIIARNVLYPEAARSEEQEGIVKIDLLLFSDGQLKEIKVKESSGFRELDETALTVVQEQAPYPSFPPQIIQKELRLIVPVVFKSFVKNE
jgi:TonB family protein